jgi:hypothetical protein
MNTGKVIGIILIIVGFIVLGLGSLLAFVISNTMGGSVLGVVFAFLFSVPFFAVGGFMLVRGQSEAQAMGVVKKQKQLLGMIRAQGEVDIAQAALELDESRSEVRQHVYDLVNKELFTGYINWDDGMLISMDAAKIEFNQCPNCGGQLELAGKGVVECPYCGTEIFLRPE